MTTFNTAIQKANLLCVNDTVADGFKYEDREHSDSVALAIRVANLVKYAFTKKECDAAYYDRIVGDWVLCADTTSEVRIDLFETTRIGDY